MAYRIALLIDGLEVPKPVRNLVDWATGHPDMELCALLVEMPESPGEERTGALGRRRHVAAAGARTVVDWMATLESRLLRRREPDRGQPRLRSISDRAVPRLAIPTCSGPGALAESDAAAAEAVCGLHLDAIICCGDRAPGEAIARAARDGAVWMEFGDSGPGFEGAAGFREVAGGEPLTRFGILRSLDGKIETLFRGSVATDLFYSRHRASLFERAIPYLRATIERLARGGVTGEPLTEGDMRRDRPPSVLDICRYAGRTFARVSRKAFRRALGKEWNFGVAYVFHPWRTASLGEGVVLPAPRGTFLADPFAITVDGRHYVFVEEFSFSSRKGVISVFEVAPEGSARRGVALEEPYHLSFPFLLRDGGKIYMVPEGNADQSIKLYECERFPDCWSLRKTLMAGVSAVDTILFQHGGRWWMLTTIKGAGEAANNAELHAFCADTLLSHWRPHAANPIVMDAARGRNGGMVRDEDGQLYRVAQRSGFDAYGTGCAIYRIDALSPDVYRESLVRDIHPTFFEGLCGNHHLHSEDGLTVYDFCRDERP